MSQCIGLCRKAVLKNLRGTLGIQPCESVLTDWTEISSLGITIFLSFHPFLHDLAPGLVVALNGQRGVEHSNKLRGSLETRIESTSHVRALKSNASVTAQVTDAGGQMSNNKREKATSRMPE